MSSSLHDDHPTGVPSSIAPPRLCVGLPVYNGERFLEESLDSILDQTFANFELIVSDNASTDGTAEIVERYAKQDSRVRYVRHDTNIGASANFDSVLRLCRSEYFKWAADDDVCAPRFFEACIAALDANSDAALAYPRAAFIDEDSMTMYAFDSRVTTPDVWSSDRIRRTSQVADVLLQDGSSANVMIFGVARTEVLLGVRPIGKYFGADMPLVAELVMAAGVVEIPEIMCFLRRHDGSSSTYARAASARVQQNFYDPSVRGSLRIRWNLRRRYLALLWLAASDAGGMRSRVRMTASVVSAISRRLRWRVEFERNARKGIPAPEYSWPGGAVHWTQVVDGA